MLDEQTRIMYSLADSEFMFDLRTCVITEETLVGHKDCNPPMPRNLCGNKGAIKTIYNSRTSQENFPYQLPSFHTLNY